MATASNTPSGYARDARWSFGVFIARAVGSLAFVLAASTRLESSGYGDLAALSVLTSLAAVATTGGISHAATMAASRSTDGAGHIVGAGLVSASAVCLPVLVLYLAVSQLILELPIGGALLLFGTDVAIAGVAELGGSVLVGTGRFRGAGIVWITLAVTRGVAALLVYVVGSNDLTAITMMAFIASLASIPASVMAIRTVRETMGSEFSAVELTRRGGIFAVGNLIGRTNNDFDKLFLTSRLGDAAVVGTYALGYRLVEYSSLPLAALSSAAYPRLFRAGSDGLDSARDLARRLAVLYLGTGLAITVGLLLTRNLVQSVFGASYDDLAFVIAALAPLPIIRAANSVLAEPLTGAGHHRIRVMSMTLSLAVNVALIVMLFDSIGWQIAIWATYASELLQVLILIIIATVAGRRQSHVAEFAVAEL